MQKVAPVAPAEGLPAEPVLRRIRIPFIQRARVTAGGGSEDLFVLDLGLRGLFLERPEGLAPGQEIEVDFRLPGNEIEVHARCRVAWWRPVAVPAPAAASGGTAGPKGTLPAGIGVEFVEMSERDAERVREHLLAYLARHPRHRQFLRHPEAEEEA
jgi:hypothetical protein